MKKLISMFLSLLLFLGVSPVALAGGIDTVEVLSDGTRLTYVSTARIHEARQTFVDRISRNRERRFSTGGNVAMKAAALTGGALLCCAASKVENPYLQGGLMVFTVLAAFLLFFCPEYIRYDVYRNEEITPLVHTGPSVERGLAAFVNRIDDYIRWSEQGNISAENGIIVVERPRGYTAKNSSWAVLSGVYQQDPHDMAHISRRIEYVLKHNLDQIKN